MADDIEITCVLHAETRVAVLISDDGNEARAQWIPRSQIEMVATGRPTQITRRNGRTGYGQIVEITMPGWLARQRELV